MMAIIEIKIRLLTGVSTRALSWTSVFLIILSGSYLRLVMDALITLGSWEEPEEDKVYVMLRTN